MTPQATHPSARSSTGQSGAARPFYGIWATLQLPIDESDRIIRSKLAGQISHLLRSGVHGIYSNGTACEFDMQTEEEFDWLNGELAGACHRAGMPFQVGVSHSSPTVLLGRLRRALALKPTGLQFILPAWSALNDQEVIDYCRRVADEANGLPLVLYSPPHAKRALDPVMFGRLADSVPSLVATKLVDGDEAWYAQMKAHAGRLALFVPGHQLATGFSRGAAGSFSNVACLSPAGARKWYDQMQTDLPGALELEKRIRAFLGAHVAPRLGGPTGLSNQAADKLLATIGGWAEITPRVRWPYHSFELSYAEQLRPIAREMMPEILPS